MSEVWKYQLKHGYQTILTPRESRLLYVDEQHDHAVLYALIENHNSKTLEREIVVVGTGQDFNSAGCTPLGLVKMLNGVLMFHVFEVTRRQDP